LGRYTSRCPGGTAWLCLNGTFRALQPSEKVRSFPFKVEEPEYVRPLGKNYREGEIVGGYVEGMGEPAREFGREIT
jgi:hypothetical protein